MLPYNVLYGCLSNVVTVGGGVNIAYQASWLHTY